MAASTPITGPIELPELPVSHEDFISYLNKNPNTPVSDLLAPFKTFENTLRKAYAQQPDHGALENHSINTVPLFSGHEDKLRIRARSLEDEAENERYIMPLEPSGRKPNGAPAVVESLRGFKKNLNLFSESSLVDMDWSNVVAAGSSVVTALLPVPDKYSTSKRALREYYHEKLAPASDVDLFIYGLNEEEAIKKLKQIEAKIRDSILQETTVSCFLIVPSVVLHSVPCIRPRGGDLSPEIRTSFDAFELFRRGCALRWSETLCLHVASLLLKRSS